MRTHARCTIPPGAAIPDAFERVTLPSLRMAVLTLKGSFDQNPKGWDNLYGSWLPVSGLRQGAVSYILPALVLGSVSLAYIARLTRTSIVENMRSDYVRTATAKGLSRGRVVGIHTLRNSMIPVVTFLAIDLGGLMGGAIITETIFNLPGLGRAVFEGVQRQEGTVVVGIVTFLVIVYLVANLFVDVLYAVLDPRIRYG